MPGIDSGESYKRICEGLRAEKAKRHGKIGKIEQDLDLGAGYLAKVCRGTATITLDRLLRVLERMEIDPGRFFANALGARLENDALLEEFERFGEIDKRLARIEKVTARLEVSATDEPAPEPIDAEAMVADFVRCNGREQRGRLGRARKYRHPAFAAAYLEHLDALRYDDPKEARQNAEAMAVKLIPQLPGLRLERLALQLKAIGIYASCHRQKGRWATAARALRWALSMSRRHRLEKSTAELLLRAACILSDNGKYSGQLKLLDEALVIYYTLDLHLGLGEVMVDRGGAFFGLGEYQQAADSCKRSLKLLRGDTQRTTRYLVAANQVLAHAYQALGDLDLAETALARAIQASKKTNSQYRAMLLWHHGRIAIARESYDAAEQSLRQASTLLGELNDRHKALVMLDLAKVLLVKGEHLEAIAIAMSMAEYLVAFRGNRIAEAAISELAQIAVRGNLTLDAIGATRDKLVATSERSQPERQT